MDAEDDECWFHSSIASRNEAEQILNASGFLEGRFLVRPSSTSLGDFVLSVQTDNRIVHYQIRSRGQSFNPLFSLAEESKVIHGLDELVHYYRHHPCNNLQHELTTFVRGQRCPLEVRLHGVDNLLHRAAQMGNTRIVQEILTTSHKNLLAKNSEGRNALHLATINNHVDIVSLLLEQDHVENESNAFDSSGQTPLHTVCQVGNVQILQLLLHKGQADPTLREQKRGWVAMHEAAFNGHLECVKLLEKHGAPLRPRSPREETPFDLALAQKHEHVVQHLLLRDALDLEKNNEENIDFESRLVHCIDRSRTVAMLDDDKCNDGSFLIRRSRRFASRDNKWVLSLRCQRRIFHFEILQQGLFIFLDQGPYMRSLAELLHHYSTFEDGLPCKLSLPLLVSNSLEVENQRRQRRLNNRRAEVTQSQYGLCGRQVRSEWVRLDGDAAIGEGEFGCVFKGKYFDPIKGAEIAVAVKVLNSLERSQQEAFIKEAQVMVKLQHPCIVKLMGVCESNPIMMLMELMSLGSLLSFLQLHPTSINVDEDIPLWASQVALGMHFLSVKGFVHRDLAARNILLSSRTQAKISDFGLSRHLPDGKDYYRASNGGRWPVKWYAPECIKCSTFTSASDVWSFGVLMWEMYSLGQIPYGDLSGSESIAFVEEGKRLSRPALAEVHSYAIMSWCWELWPEKRPTFQELLKELGNHMDKETMDC